MGQTVSQERANSNLGFFESLFRLPLEVLLLSLQKWIDAPCVCYSL